MILDDDVVLRFKIWQNIDPKECRCDSHFDQKGQPLPNENVCARERAWRQYVRVRDGRIKQQKEKELQEFKLDRSIFSDLED